MTTQTPPTVYYQVTLSAEAYVETASTVGVKLDGSEPFSIDVWIKFSGLGSDSNILSQGSAFAFGISDDQVFVQIAGFSTVDSDPAISAIDTESWHFITVTFDGFAIAIYIDGNLNVRQEISGTPPVSTDAILIGQNVEGRLSSLRVYDQALAEDTVLDSMFGTEVPSGCVANFDFSQYPPVDTSPSHYPLTLKDGAVSTLKAPSVLLQGTAYCQPVRDTSVNPGGGGKDSYTVQAWIWLDGAALTNTVFVNADLEADSGMALYLTYDDASQKFYVNALHGSSRQGGTVLKSQCAVAPMTWTNVATTYDGATSTLTIYIDGKSDISGSAPNVATQSEGNCLIGASLKGGQPAGDDTFQGYIAILDVWDIALTAEQIITYLETVAEPESNQTANYNFLTLPIRNAISGQPVGLIDGAELGNQSQNMPPAPATVVAPAVEPLAPEVLARFRDEARAGFDEFLKSDPDYFKRALDQDLAPETMQQVIPPDLFPAHEKRMRAAWTEVARTARAEPFALPSFVTSHEHQGTRYLVWHTPDQSQVVYQAPAVELSDCAWWVISVIKTVVSGFLKYFGVNAWLTDMASEYIDKYILPDLTLMEALRANLAVTTITAGTVFQLVVTLHLYGRLWPLIKMALLSLGWFAFGRLLVWININCFGYPAAAAETIAGMANTATQLTYVMTQKPQGCIF